MGSFLQRGYGWLTFGLQKNNKICWQMQEKLDPTTESQVKSFQTWNSITGRSRAKHKELQTWNALRRLSVHIQLFLFFNPLLISHRHALPWQPWEFWVMANKQRCQPPWLFQPSRASACLCSSAKDIRKKHTFKGVFTRIVFSFFHILHHKVTALLNFAQFRLRQW